MHAGQARISREAPFAERRCTKTAPIQGALGPQCRWRTTALQLTERQDGRPRPGPSRRPVENRAQHGGEGPPKARKTGKEELSRKPPAPVGGLPKQPRSMHQRANGRSPLRVARGPGRAAGPVTGGGSGRRHLHHRAPVLRIATLTATSNGRLIVDFPQLHPPAPDRGMKPKPRAHTDQPEGPGPLAGAADSATLRQAPVWRPLPPAHPSI